MFQVLLFLVGFYILIKGAKILVSGASAIATVLKLSPWVIGVLVVGIGTSLPEFSINLAAALKGNSVGIGTIIGSNTFNLLLILGLTTMLSPAVIRTAYVKRDFLINIVVVVTAAAFLHWPILGATSFIGITQEEALIFLITFAIWVLFMLYRSPESKPEVEQSEKLVTLSTALLLVGFGIIGVIAGGQFVVNGAERLALALGINSGLVGVLFVGIGTSLPELTVSITAALKRQTGLAVGNIIGSNIFDFLGIIGLVGLIAPIPFSQELIFDVGFTAFAAFLLLGAMFVNKQLALTRSEGLVFVLVYIFYVIFTILRAPFSF